MKDSSIRSAQSSSASTVLLVDDDEKEKESLCAILSEAGYNFSSVSRRTEALELLERRRIDVCLSDVSRTCASSPLT